jgi:hypothetical protein
VSADQKRRSYEDAGYNKFFRRTLNSNSVETNLSSVGAYRQYKPSSLDFDSTQTSGAIGDVLRVGKGVQIDGPRQKISIYDEQGQETTRLGLRDE